MNNNPKRGDLRYDQYGQMRCMAHAENWVMFRRKGSAAGCMSAYDWLALSTEPLEKDSSHE